MTRRGHGRDAAPQRTAPALPLAQNGRAARHAGGQPAHVPPARPHAAAPRVPLVVLTASDDESLQVWHNGKQILDTPANTGIAAAPTGRSR